MFINGPINVIRLEGTIKNINKIIYVYFDYHAPLSLQTECESYDSINIVKYFYNLFKNTTKELDFFFEIKSSLIKKEVSPFKNIYIKNISKFYNKAKFNDELKKNIKNNIRFHYLDIRDHLEKNIYNNIDNLHISIKNLRTNKDIFSNDYNNINYACSNLLYELKIYKDFFDNELNNTNSRTTKNTKIFNKPENIITYFLDKITKKYKNKEIINKIKKNYFNDIIIEINSCISKLQELHKLVLDKENYVYRYYDQKINYKNTKNIDSFFGIYIDFEELDNFIYKCDNLNEDIQKKILFIFCRLTDLFFLRRFLDKDYITNAITYTGSAHSINFIHMLVSYFDFKITHYSYSDEKNINKLNNIAKNDIHLLDYILHPQHLIQCSNLENFPNDFN